MNITSPARTAETSATASPDRRSIRCETSTPFGRPVVPDVYITANVSSAAGAALRSMTASPRASTIACTASVVKICTADRFAPLAAIVAVSAASAMISFGAEWSKM